MSLRDQLLAKGLVSKKDARKANRDLKKQRKLKQSKRQKKHVVEAKAADEQSKHRAESLKKKLKYYCAEVSVHDHKELVRIYGDPPEPKLTKTFKIPESRTVGLNFKNLKKKNSLYCLVL